MWFLFIGSHVCSTLPSDLASRQRPCVLLSFTSIRLAGDFHPQVVEHAWHTLKFFCRFAALECPNSSAPAHGHCCKLKLVIGEDDAKADTTVVRILLDSVSPPHPAMQVPVMMTATA
jgi:hypothetical protein